MYQRPPNPKLNINSPKRAEDLAWPGFWTQKMGDSSRWLTHLKIRRVGPQRCWTTDVDWQNSFLQHNISSEIKNKKQESFHHSNLQFCLHTERVKSLGARTSHMQSAHPPPARSLHNAWPRAAGVPQVKILRASACPKDCTTGVTLGPKSRRQVLRRGRCFQSRWDS